MLELVRMGGWSVGVGAGPVEEPLPASTRAARGPAFVMAREAVERAKRRPAGLAVVAADAEAGREAEAVLALLAVIVGRRRRRAWDAVDLVADGLSVTEAAQKLGITRQAAGQRLAAGNWQQDGTPARAAAQPPGKRGHENPGSRRRPGRAARADRWQARPLRDRIVAVPSPRAGLRRRVGFWPARAGRKFA